MRSCTTLLALLLAPLAAAAAQEPAFSVGGGAGYYEQAYLGAAYHPAARATISLFGGYGLGKSEQIVTLGAGFSHALLDPVWTFQPGLGFKAIYWTQSDDLYDWKNLSLVLGPSVSKELGKGVRVSLDAGVAFTVALESNRKQDFTFGSPTRWNGSVCVGVGYRVPR